MLRQWTEVQKKQLLAALQEYGMNDLIKVAECVEGKTLYDIKYAIAAYEKIAIASLKDETALTQDRRAPIDGWLDVLRYAATNKYASDDIVTMLRFIANCGEHNDVDVVNLKECYLYISDLMMGNAPKQLNSESMEFIMSCILKMGAMVKESKTIKEEEFLSKLKLSDITQKTYASKKAFVCSDPSLNVLKVPLHLLKIDKKEVQH